MVLRALLVVFGALWGAASDNYDLDKPYKALSYEAMLAGFEALEKKFPDLLQVEIAEEKYKTRGVKGFRDCGGGQECKTLIVRIGHKPSLTAFTPEVFLSGALHGNERLGPHTVAYLAEILCHKFGEDEHITWLMKNRVIWAMPMTNPYGFKHNVREEQCPQGGGGSHFGSCDMDPNRDFPYKQSGERCMRTITARAVNELYHDHLFQLAISFHGGVRSLSYEWGSYDHAVSCGPNCYKSKETPDQIAEVYIGEQIRDAAGKAFGRDWYPLGSMDELVYPVNGGMEDWSYAGSWEKAPETIGTCRPPTFGGKYAEYPASRTTYNQWEVRCLMYLAEMDNSKNPPESTYGNPRGIFSPSDKDGHISRNIRLTMKMIELLKPDVIFRAALPTSLHRDNGVEVQVKPAGCQKAEFLKLVALPGACATHREADFKTSSAIDLAALSEHDCFPYNSWEETANSAQSLVLQRSTLPPALATGEVCLAVLAQFDKHWGDQNHPDPLKRPQAHVTRARLDPEYRAENAGKIVQGRDVWVFPHSADEKTFGVDVRLLNPGEELVPSPAKEGGTSTSGGQAKDPVEIVDELRGPSATSGVTASAMLRVPLVTQAEGMGGSALLLVDGGSGLPVVGRGPRSGTSAVVVNVEARHNGDACYLSVKPANGSSNVPPGDYVIRVRDHTELHLSPSGEAPPTTSLIAGPAHKVAGVAEGSHGVLMEFSVEPTTGAPPGEELGHLKLPAATGYKLYGRTLTIERAPAVVGGKGAVGLGALARPSGVSGGSGGDALSCLWVGSGRPLFADFVEGFAEVSLGSAGVKVEGLVCEDDSGQAHVSTSESSCCPGLDIYSGQLFSQRFDQSKCNCKAGDTLSLSLGDARGDVKCVLGYQAAPLPKGKVKDHICGMMNAKRWDARFSSGKASSLSPGETWFLRLLVVAAAVVIFLPCVVLCCKISKGSSTRQRLRQGYTPSVGLQGPGGVDASGPPGGGGAPTGVHTAGIRV
uniref:Peptidase M14 domain-containing protein n=1 Tax=Chromera velia CCMP2878 TaxID=1169474 RepID=A0A0G4GYP3_9ALVE